MKILSTSLWTMYFESVIHIRVFKSITYSQCQDQSTPNETVRRAGKYNNFMGYITSSTDFLKMWKTVVNVLSVGFCTLHGFVVFLTTTNYWREGFIVFKIMFFIFSLRKASWLNKNQRLVQSSTDHHTDGL